jgi:hypothetical protein
MPEGSIYEELSDWQELCARKENRSEKGLDNGIPKWYVKKTDFR